MMDNSDESVVYVLSSAGATSSGSHEAVTLSELVVIWRYLNLSFLEANALSKD